MGGKCIRCGKQMKWQGNIWLYCEHCGQLQMWQSDRERRRDNEVLEIIRRKSDGNELRDGS